MTKTYTLKKSTEALLKPSIKAVKDLHKAVLNTVLGLQDAPAKATLVYDGDGNQWHLATDSHVFSFPTFIGAVDAIQAAIETSGGTYSSFASSLRASGF